MMWVRGLERRIALWKEKQQAGGYKVAEVSAKSDDQAPQPEYRQPMVPREALVPRASALPSTRQPCEYVAGKARHAARRDTRARAARAYVLLLCAAVYTSPRASCCAGARESNEVAG